MPTMVRSSPPTHVISACMCAKRQYGTRAHKATLNEIEDKVVKINQAIHDVPRGLQFTYCLGSRLNSP